MEYIHDGSLDCPLIRLFDFETDDVTKLQTVCYSLVAAQAGEVALETLPWVRAIGGRRLWLRAGAKNRGVRSFCRDGSAPKSTSQPFVMQYNREGWLEVAEELAPFIAGTDGFQWLTNEGDVNVLISRDGRPTLPKSFDTPSS